MTQKEAVLSLFNYAVATQSSQLLFPLKILPFNIINRNPHCSNNITKTTACGYKEQVLPHPLHSTVGGGGAVCRRFT
jgi:hypothetical protein